MTDNILSIIHQRQQEVRLAKATLKELPHEVAQIVFYTHGSDVAHCVRFLDMKEAKKKFDALVKAISAKTQKPFVLAGSNSTIVIQTPEMIGVSYLSDVQANLFLMADSQKRMQAMMQV